jgi:hypothetical protein
MNILESEWLGQRLETLPAADLFPLLNVGSSTGEFRIQTQPWIDMNIFAPMRLRGGTVYHLDIKEAEGVDIVGDLFNPKFLNRLAQMNLKSLMVSNLFEHVANRREIAEVLQSIVPPGGYIVISGPKSYPYHADPIDTMFRPTLEEMHAYFPGTEVIDSAVIDSGNWRQWHVGERGRSLARTVARMLVPFYKPRQWWDVAQQLPYLFKHITAFAIILRVPPKVQLAEHRMALI